MLQMSITLTDNALEADVLFMDVVEPRRNVCPFMRSTNLL